MNLASCRNLNITTDSADEPEKIITSLRVVNSTAKSKTLKKKSKISRYLFAQKL